MTDNLPAKSDAVLAAMGGQASLFDDDPTRILLMDDARFAELVAVVRSGGESLIAGVRRYVGLLAWAAWHRYDEKRYKEFVADFASRLGVEPRNVLDWRRAVTKTDNLPLPPMAKARSDARKGAGQTPVNTKSVLIPATSQEVPARKSESKVQGTPSPSSPLSDPLPERVEQVPPPTPPSGPPLSGRGSVAPPTERNPTERVPTLRQEASTVFHSLMDATEGIGAKWTASEVAAWESRSNREVATWRKANGLESKPERRQGYSRPAQPKAETNGLSRPQAAVLAGRAITKPDHDPTCSCYGCKPPKAAAK